MLLGMVGCGAKIQEEDTLPQWEGTTAQTQEATEAVTEDTTEVTTEVITEETTEAVTEEVTQEVTEETLPEGNASTQILENVWALHTEEARFPIIGGNAENYVDARPWDYNMEYAENLQYNLLIPVALLEDVDEASLMMHMYNTNVFSGGIVHMKDGVDASAAAQAIRDNIMGNSWSCNVPDCLLVAVVDGSYVVVAFGQGEQMQAFYTHLQEAYPQAQIPFYENIEL